MRVSRRVYSGREEANLPRPSLPRLDPRLSGRSRYPLRLLEWSWSSPTGVRVNLLARSLLVSPLFDMMSSTFIYVRHQLAQRLRLPRHRLTLLGLNLKSPRRASSRKPSPARSDLIGEQLDPSERSRRSPLPPSRPRAKHLSEVNLP